MVYSRLIFTICAGIAISGVLGLIAFYLPILHNIIGILVILCLTYIASGMISLWANKEAPYLAASISGICICTFQYFFIVFFAVGEMIFTPDIFSLSLFIALVISNLGAWLKLEKQKQ